MNSPLLITDVPSHDAGVTLLREEGVHDLTCVLRKGEAEGAIRAWNRNGGDLSGIDLIALGDHMRGEASEMDAPVGLPTMIKGVPLEDLEQLPRVIDRGRVDDADVVLLCGIPDLLVSVGISRTIATIETLIDSHQTSIVIPILDVTPTSVVRGLAHYAEEVVEPIIDGQAMTLQPVTHVAGLSVETIFELLAPPRRRALLLELDRAGEDVSLRQMAESVLDHPLGDHNWSVDRLLTALYQIDIPRLVDTDLIKFDPERRTVGIRAEAIQVWPYLTVATQGSRI